MAHFCKYCGAKLEDGQTCSCPQSVAAATQQQPQQIPSQPIPQQQIPAQPMPQQQYAPQNVAPSAINRWINNVKLFIKSPATVARTAVCKRQFKSGLIFMGIASVLMGFIALVLSSKVNIILDGLNSLMSMFGGDEAKINLASVFFTDAVLCFGLLCLFAVFIMLFAKCFKCNMKYTHALAATGMASIVAVPFLVLAIISALTISSFLSAGIIFMLLFIVAAKIAGLFITIEAIKDDKYLTNNNAVYVVFLALAATAVCLLIVGYIKSYTLITEVTDSFSRISKLGGGLSKLF